MSGTGRFSIQYADETVAFAIQILRQPGIWTVLCSRYVGTQIKRWNPDILVPVPMTCRKKRIRGFNQAEDLAEKIGELLQIPVAAGLAVKKRETKSQKKLNAAERMRNLKDAFQITESVRGLRILIVDDVYTTGSTIETLAECLKESGAGKIYFVTLCIGQL